MTEAEAKRIVAKLKSGKQFITRFQEDEWGIDYLGNGRFRHWSRQGMFEVKESFAEVDQPAIITLLCKYDYEIIKARLR